MCNYDTNNTFGISSTNTKSFFIDFGFYFGWNKTFIFIIKYYFNCFIWFIDFDDKVCIRIPRRASFNLKNVMKEVSKLEDKFEIELKFRNTYLTAYDWKEVKYPKDLNKNEKKIV